MVDQHESLKMPKDWPINKFEVMLTRLNNLLTKFAKEPSYKLRDVIVSITCDYDLNQVSIKGLVRLTDYTIQLMNDIYARAAFMQFCSVKVLLYKYITVIVRAYKTVDYMYPSRDIFKPFENLNFQLLIFYKIYRVYNQYKDNSFTEEIVLDIKLLAEQYKEHKNLITRGFISVINDISYFASTDAFSLFTFSREEFKNLIMLIADLLKECNYNITERPHKGVLCTLISNYVLKSRNNYNSDYICKYMSESAANLSAENKQIWLRKIELLNDSRETKVVPELFSDKTWIKYKWVKEPKLEPNRIYYVSSFCKNINDQTMKKMYGNCIYGYKNDRIAETISPIHYYYYDFDDITLPVLSQVITFDVIYKDNEIKEELNYLCELIDLFDLTNDEKNIFLEEILQYWILSVKDKKWEYEKERRYVIFLYDNYEYIEINALTEDFLKIKTSLFLYPDFLISDAASKTCIENKAYEKRLTIYKGKKYHFCENCLSFDFDNLYDKVEKCPICSSSDYYLINEYGEVVEKM